MRKWIILIMLMATMPLVLGAGEYCQISTDNSTWGNVSITRWGGCVDDENNVSYAQNLEECTTYNLRCTNEATAWGYASFKTECGWNGMYLAISFIGIIFIVIGLYLLFRKRFNDDDEE